MKSNLKDILYDRKINISEFARTIGVSRQCIYRLMEDDCNPSMGIARKISDQLDLSIEDIWE